MRREAGNAIQGWEKQARRPIPLGTAVRREAGNAIQGWEKQARRPVLLGRREAGVTLIELLIAVTLVAALATGMLMALRVGLSALDKSNARLMGNRRAASVERILESQVGGIMPVKAQCRPGAESPSALVPFFQGDDQSMRFVSTYSLQQGGRGLPMILEFQVIPGDQNQGVRLIVNEHVYTGPFGTGAFCAGLIRDPTGAMQPAFLPIETGPGSFVLADKLAYCHFSYRQVFADPNLPPLWFQHWSRPLLPNAIQIQMAPLQSDSARLQLLPLTIPVHVTKDPMKEDYEY